MLRTTDGRETFTTQTWCEGRDILLYGNKEFAIAKLPFIKKEMSGDPANGQLINKEWFRIEKMIKRKLDGKIFRVEKDKIFGDSSDDDRGYFTFTEVFPKIETIQVYV